MSTQLQESESEKQRAYKIIDDLRQSEPDLDRMIRTADPETLERVYAELQQDLGKGKIKSIRIKKNPKDKGWLS